MKLFNAIVGISGILICCTGNGWPVKANPVLYFDKAIGLMYYHARVPNQRGVCTYADDAMTAALELWDQDKVNELKKVQARFNC